MKEKKKKVICNGNGVFLTFILYHKLNKKSTEKIEKVAYFLENGNANITYSLCTKKGVEVLPKNIQKKLHYVRVEFDEKSF